MHEKAKFNLPNINREYNIMNYVPQIVMKYTKQIQITNKNIIIKKDINSPFYTVEKIEPRTICLSYTTLELYSQKLNKSAF